MKVAVALLALIAASLAVDLPCTYQDKMHRTYDLSRLRRHRGQSPYVHLADGVKYEFNVCGDLEGLQGMSNHTKAVVMRNGENAGQRAEWSDLSSKERGVEVVYGEGVPCKNSQRKTTFEFLCDEQRTEAMYVFRVQPVDSCYEIVTIYTLAACPIEDNDEMETSEEVSGLMIPFPMLLGFLLMCCCGTCFAIRRRKNHEALKRKNREKQLLQYSNVAFHQIPMEEYPMPPKPQPVAPQMAKNQPLQFLQAPQYFVYPSVQVPVQQEPASLESDEEMARRLQAEWN
jgi:hypothetical protein